MSDQLWAFSATHYAGTQKMTRVNADRLRAINPGFLILHYRLGLGLGYRSVENGCQPTGEYLHIIEGNDWVQEYPPAELVQDAWFYHYPEPDSERILNCDWGWYLMDISNPAWRTYWQAELARQLIANDDDGLFLDSLSVPNYLGAESYSTALPAVDPLFEQDWTNRIDDLLTWLQTQKVGKKAIIPNAGSWITTRDQTTYAAADGVMIEGFALEADDSPYALVDWQLQMNRVLSLAQQGKIIIAQTYVYGEQERMFALGSYLLTRGNHSFLNIEWDYSPEWFPEYDLPVGEALSALPVSIGYFYDSSNQVYRRYFTNAQVIVNPTSPYDGTGQTRTVQLGGSYYLAQPTGGGIVPDTGIPEGSLTYTAVTQVTLPPYSAVVLFTSHP